MQTGLVLQTLVDELSLSSSVSASAHLEHLQGYLGCSIQETCPQPPLALFPIHFYGWSGIFQNLKMQWRAVYNIIWIEQPRTQQDAFFAQVRLKTNFLFLVSQMITFLAKCSTFNPVCTYINS